MWTVKPPTATAADAAHACATGIKDADLSSRLKAEAVHMHKNSHVFQEMARLNECHTVDESTFDVKTLSNSELVWLYENRLTRSRSGRTIYNQIMQSAPFGHCAYCFYGVASTLDHFVPKTLSPALSIDPWNLIPCCKDCNHVLGNHFSSNPEEEFLHPYFMPPTGRWLYAQVLPSNPPVLRFSAEPDVSLPAQLRSRIVNQFEQLKLGELYSDVSVSELVQISSHVKLLKDEKSIKAHLGEMAAAAATTGENSRRSVIYEALASSDWYCQGGYQF